MDARPSQEFTAKFLCVFGGCAGKSMRIFKARDVIRKPFAHQMERSHKNKVRYCKHASDRCNLQVKHELLYSTAAGTFEFSLCTTANLIPAQSGIEL